MEGHRVNRGFARGWMEVPGRGYRANREGEGVRANREGVRANREGVRANREGERANRESWVSGVARLDEGYPAVV